MSEGSIYGTHIITAAQIYSLDNGIYSQ